MPAPGWSRTWKPAATETEIGLSRDSGYLYVEVKKETASGVAASTHCGAVQPSSDGEVERFRTRKSVTARSPLVFGSDGQGE